MCMLAFQIDYQEKPEPIKLYYQNYFFDIS